MLTAKERTDINRVIQSQNLFAKTLRTFMENDPTAEELLGIWVTYATILDTYFPHSKAAHQSRRHTWRVVYSLIKTL